MILRADRQKPPNHRSGSRVRQHRVTGHEKHTLWNSHSAGASPARSTRSTSSRTLTLTPTDGGVGTLFGAPNRRQQSQRRCAPPPQQNESEVTHEPHHNRRHTHGTPSRPRHPAPHQKQNPRRNPAGLVIDQAIEETWTLATEFSNCGKQPTSG